MRISITAITFTLMWPAIAAGVTAVKRRIRVPVALPPPQGRDRARHTHISTISAWA
ncbi:hypothetical protein GCM10007921_13290 [Tritonibacter mobilis]|nr:hypothetical protein GCM10007921_13290 [Tritonibacter mobilis]